MNLSETLPIILSVHDSIDTYSVKRGLSASLYDIPGLNDSSDNYTFWSA